MLLLGEIGCNFLFDLLALGAGRFRLRRHVAVRKQCRMLWLLLVEYLEVVEGIHRLLWLAGGAYSCTMSCQLLVALVFPLRRLLPQLRRRWRLALTPKQQLHCRRIVHLYSVIGRCSDAGGRQCLTLLLRQLFFLFLLLLFPLALSLLLLLLLQLLLQLLLLQLFVLGFVAGEEALVAEFFESFGH